MISKLYGHQKARISTNKLTVTQFVRRKGVNDNHRFANLIKVLSGLKDSLKYKLENLKAS